MKNVSLGVGGCLLILAMMFGISALVAFILMIAWNAVMPYLFDLPALSFWQSFAFMVVLHIILSGARTVISRGK